MKKIIQKQLGELLVESQVISHEQLKEGLEIQKEKGGLIGEVLVGLGYATEHAIAQALTVQYGFPYLPLGDYDIDPETARLIPETLARRHGLIAVDHLGNLLTVAMCNPLSTQAIEEVEKATRLNVQAFVATHTDVNQAIGRCYKES